MTRVEGFPKALSTKGTIVQSRAKGLQTLTIKSGSFWIFEQYLQDVPV